MFLKGSRGSSVDAYRQLEPILLQIPKDKLEPLRFSATQALSRGLWMSSNAVKDIPLFKATFVEPPIEAIQNLEPASLAVKGADLLFSRRNTVPKPDIKLARSLKKRYLAIVRAVFPNNDEVEKRLNEVRKGRGYINLGGDLISLGSIIFTYKDMLVASGLLLKEEVDKLEPLGKHILQWTALQGSPEKKISREEERRAWTYMVGLYNEIRVHAGFIYRDDLKNWKRKYPHLLNPRDSKSF